MIAKYVMINGSAVGNLALSLECNRAPFCLQHVIVILYLLALLAGYFLRPQF